MVRSCAGRKSARRDTVTHIDGSRESFGPETLVNIFLVQHTTNKIHESAVHALSHPILLRSICNGELVVDTVGGEVRFEIV